MQPEMVIAELKMNDCSMADIGRQCGVTRQYVWQVVHGVRSDRAIERAIVRAVKRPMHEVFPGGTWSKQKHAS